MSFIGIAVYLDHSLIEAMYPCELGNFAKQILDAWLDLKTLKNRIFMGFINKECVFLSFFYSQMFVILSKFKIWEFKQSSTDL